MDALSNHIRVSGHSKSSITLAANAASVIDIDIALSGYSFVGVVGYALYGTDRVVITRLILESGTTLKVGLLNASASSQTISALVVNVLYKSNN